MYCFIAAAFRHSHRTWHMQPFCALYIFSNSLVSSSSSSSSSRCNSIHQFIYCTLEINYRTDCYVHLNRTDCYVQTVMTVMSKMLEGDFSCNKPKFHATLRLSMQQQYQWQQQQYYYSTLLQYYRIQQQYYPSTKLLVIQDPFTNKKMKREAKVLLLKTHDYLPKFPRHDCLLTTRLPSHL